MSISNVGSNQPLQQVSTTPPLRAAPATTGETPVPATDRLQLSGASHLLDALKANSGIRADKVSTIKSQIDAGTYEDDGKLNGAIDKLLDDLNK
ncbi:MAG TPA: flagellar biosynthesis anti-sigma factor FlgM [Tepidisphaeraceae bacterium]|jgi:anti-sigma28 factor (negative regulator of flagellin synthesis)|nr:flagellar biosynthesis anti-sigma factor FlgM [Tepidisphaeraceae bacterium]